MRSCAKRNGLASTIGSWRRISRIAIFPFPAHNRPAMSSQGRFFLSAAVVSIAGMLALAYATQSGAGLSPDSRGYLSSARFILQGKGISNLDGNGTVVPLTHFAPLYPILLAGSGAGGDPLDRAR